MATTHTTDTHGPLISTQQAADELGVSRAMIRTLLGTEITGVRVGRILKVDADSLAAYRTRQTLRAAQ